MGTVHRKIYSHFSVWPKQKICLAYLFNSIRTIRLYYEKQIILPNPNPVI